MKREEILQILRELQVRYLKCIDKKDRSMASAIHDEIRRWNEDLKEVK